MLPLSNTLTPGPSLAQPAAADSQTIQIDPDAARPAAMEPNRLVLKVGPRAWVLNTCAAAGPRTAAHSPAAPPLLTRPPAQVMDIGHLRVTSSILGQSVALSQVDREVRAGLPRPARAAGCRPGAAGDTGDNPCAADTTPAHYPHVNPLPG
jgi:hypothetical protein